VDINEIEGLASTEAGKRQKKYGYNEIPDREKRGLIKLIIGLLSEPMIFLLLMTVVIYFFLGDKKEAGILMLSIFGIISIEIYQEGKTEKSLEALRNLSSPICNVIRDGKRKTIPGREVVVGDIIILSEGSRVPADAKLLSAEGFMVDESMLTGESVPVEKHTREVKDFRTNSVFSGTLAVKGHAIAEVTSIGQSTEFGKIGKSLTSIGTEKTLLQKEVSRLIKIIALLAISSSVLLSLLYWLTRVDLIQGFLAGLTLAIAIIPEEFPVVLVVFLTLGAWRLAKSNVLARRAQTIETLGSASVLCVDKTGTLTENRMRIFKVLDENGSELKKNDSGFKQIISHGILASQKRPFDPMEDAFLNSGKEIYKDLKDLYKGEEIIKEYPMEDEYLCVAHVWADNGKIKRVALKGAPETVFDLCHITAGERKKAEAKVKVLAADGFRVLAIAKGGMLSELPKDRHDFNFEFLGLVALADPIRDEVQGAIKLCHQAGVRVVMITGDYPETAAHIAREIGLDYKDVVTGANFNEMSEKRQREVVRGVSVFSRVTPAHKLDIVKALKKNGEVVAMTGDGVNDAPALKAAHIGIAMGKRGTDVAREAAAIVLLDDNFASIVDGVRLGRRIYANLRKAMSYLVSIHVPIAAMSLVPVIMGWPTVLIPAHVVFLEFIIDPSCTLIFEDEKEDSGTMSRPPRRLSEPVFNKGTAIESLIRGAIIALIISLTYWFLLRLDWPEDKARGMVFMILVFSNIFMILVISGKQAVKNLFNKDGRTMLVILTITTISLLLLFNVPFLKEVFRFAPLNIVEISAALLASMIAVLAVLPLKYLFIKK